MKYKELLGVDGDARGVSFFAYCLDEALYDYTPATYKPRVMGVRSLVIEAKSIIDRVEAGTMDRNRLNSVMDELGERLQGDAVARSLLSFPVDYYTSYAKEDPLKIILVRLGLLRNALASGRYRAALQHEIVRLAQNDREKSALREAARNWISATTGLGFSKQFVHEVVSKEFFSGPAKYRESSDLAGFFGLFNREKGSFQAVFCADRVIGELNHVLSQFRCELLSSDSESFSLRERLAVGDGEELLLVRDIHARDVYSARDGAERRLEHLSDLFAIFHHKKRIKWRPEALVRGVDGDYISVFPRSSSIARSRDNVPKMASQKLALQIGELSFSDQESLGRFMSVVRLHGAAQEAASPQAQLVNLWTAMEVLVSRESDSKLKGVKRCITPFLVFGYFDKLLYRLAGDIYRWKRRQASKVFKKVDLTDLTQHQKLGAILLGGELRAVRDDLYALVSGFPLLLNRCHQVSELISDVSRLESASRAHEKRVSWQIERIYRARNSIVHDGSAPPHVDALAENAHEYLDSFIDRFFYLCSQLKVVSTLDEAIAHQTRLYEDWRKLLVASKSMKVDVQGLMRFCALDSRIRSS